jgi:putative membrane-bound dehydrogenase-like protein
MLARGLTGLVLFSILVTGAPCVGSDDDFPQPYNSPTEADQTPMPAADAAQSMIVPEGFRVSLFAAEPDVQNPIDMAWDARGDLWIAENYTYAERAQRFDLGLRDRVVVLSDSDDDGRADRRVVFTDAVQMLTSIEVGHDGLWLMCPPQLMFIPDRDHDAVPDGPAVVVLDGFDVAKDNYHNFANGLRFGPDGWLYGRCGGSCPGKIGKPGTPPSQRIALEGGIWRYHPQRQTVEVLMHGTTNPWGHDWDATGEGFFINTVNGHLWHMIPGAHFVRPFTLDPNPLAYQLIDMHADHWHFDTTGSWTDSRDGAANDFGGGHAHCGMMIYLGDNWPQAYRGDLLTINLHGQRANREHLTRDGSGFVASHREDLMLSQDPFFRGMELSYGPDGSVYLIDWSDTGECHEHTGVHRTSGRVFKITYQGDDASPIGSAKSDLYAMPTDELVELRNHANEWYVRQARLELASRAAAGESMAEHGGGLFAGVDQGDPVSAFRALMALESMGLADDELLVRYLNHRHETVRIWAIRLLTQDWPIDDCYGPLQVDALVAQRRAEQVTRLMQPLLAMATSDPAAAVRLTLASTLQRMPVETRLALASALAQRVEDSGDHNLPLMVWYGLMAVSDHQPDALARFATTSTWPLTARLAARRSAEQIADHPSAVQIVVDAAVHSQSAEVRGNLIQGMADGLRGWRKADRPASWDQLVAVVDAAGDADMQQLVRELSLVFGDGRAVDQLKQIVMDDASEIGLRRSALQTLVQNNSDGLREICAGLLGDARLNVVAAEGLARFNDPEIGQQLAENYRRFRSPERPRIVALMVSRPIFATALLDAIEQGKISADDLTAFDVRQIRSLGEPKLDRRIAALWGDVRQTPEDKRRQIDQLKTRLTNHRTRAADLGHGRQLFAKTCMQCHRLYGSGEQVGPELTGSNRNNIDYLLENIIDPSAVVSKDYRMTVVLLDDGRVINGLVTAQSDRTITIQTQTDRQTIDRETIESLKVTNLSPMPEGLLDNLTQQQIDDLIGYLMHPSQVPLPN